MFDAVIDRRVDRIARQLADRLNARLDPSLMADANFHLKFAQYDSFVTNVMANNFSKRARLSIGEAMQVRELIDLLALAPQIEDLRRHITQGKPEMRRKP